MVNREARAVLSLNVDAAMINEEFEKLTRIGHDMGDSTYRHDGFSIGKDYLRLEGRTIGRGEILPDSLVVRTMIGQGAFSQVYKAVWKRQHDTTSIVVAIKEFCLLASSEKRGDMLMKELRALCRINCESLLRLEGAFLSDDKVTMVLEFMDRGSLEDIIKVYRRGGLAAEEGFTASVAYQMLRGLSYLHRERIMHRDVKVGEFV
jgi:Protein kinase domain